MMTMIDGCLLLIIVFSPSDLPTLSYPLPSIDLSSSPSKGGDRRRERQTVKVSRGYLLILHRKEKAKWGRQVLREGGGMERGGGTP